MGFGNGRAQLPNSQGGLTGRGVGPLERRGAGGWPMRQVLSAVPGVLYDFVWLEQNQLIFAGAKNTHPARAATGPVVGCFMRPYCAPRRTRHATGSPNAPNARHGPSSTVGIYGRAKSGKVSYSR